MRPDPRPIALAAMLVLQGVGAAAPPSPLAAKVRLAQSLPVDSTAAEDLPARPRSGRKVAPDGDPAVPPAGTGTSPASGVKPDGGTVATPAAMPTTDHGSTAAEKDGGGGAAEKGRAEAAGKGEGCGKPGCTSCIPRIPTCKPTWEDKKTKKATFAMKCDFECTRPWEPYHQGNCCEEKTTPCGNVHTKKKLFKTEEEKVERVLKYDVVMKPAVPCCEPEPACRCLGCRCLGSAFERVFGWCH